MRYCTRCATPLEEQDHDGHSWPTCPQCGFVYYRDPKVAVAVITGKEGKVLLGRRNHDPKNGLWTFPSGYVNEGEALEDAAYRETKEETGIEVQLERLLAVYSETGNPVVLVVFTRLCRGRRADRGAGDHRGRLLPPVRAPGARFRPRCRDHPSVAGWQRYPYPNRSL